MFKQFSFLSKAFVLSFFAIAALAACSSDDNNDYYFDYDQVAGLMAVNTVTDTEPIQVTLSGNYLGPALNYRAYTGGYLNIFPGSRSTNSLSPYSGNTLSSVDFTYEKGHYYSVFVTGEKGDYKNIIVEDSLEQLAVTDSTAYVRFVNAIPGEATPEVNIIADNDSLLTTTIDYQEVSEFTAIPAEEISVSANNQDNINVERTLNLEAQKVYTILIVGDPGNSDSFKRTQIRYIENGQLIEDSEDDPEESQTNLQ